MRSQRTAATFAMSVHNLVRYLPRSVWLKVNTDINCLILAGDVVWYSQRYARKIQKISNRSLGSATTQPDGRAAFLPLLPILPPYLLPFLPTPSSPGAKGLLLERGYASTHNAITQLSVMGKSQIKSNHDIAVADSISLCAKCQCTFGLTVNVLSVLHNYPNIGDSTITEINGLTQRQ